MKPNERQEVSVLEIAPTILDTFGVAIPDYMQSPSLLTTGGHSILH
jgi:bisphosphoglycerate-independent phosphoglycerate mutase (AlkP superfamily)